MSVSSQKGQFSFRISKMNQPIHLMSPELNYVVPTTMTSDIWSTEFGRNVRWPTITAGPDTTLRHKRYEIPNNQEETTREHCSRHAVETDSSVPMSSRQDDCLSSAVQESGEFPYSSPHFVKMENNLSAYKISTCAVSNRSGTVAAATESASKSHDEPNIVKTQQGVLLDDDFSLHDHTDSSQSGVQHQAAAEKKESEKHRQEIEQLGEANRYQAKLICQLRAQVVDQDKKIVELNQRLALTDDSELFDIFTYQIACLKEDFDREKQDKERLMNEKKSLEIQVDRLLNELQKVKRTTESS